MDPQQIIFTALRQLCVGLFDNVYDGALPPEGAPYPFVYIGDNSQTDRMLKGAALAPVVQTLHVWHNDPEQRGTVSDMLNKIKIGCYNLESTTYGITIRSVSQRIITDTTTNAPLLHGVLEVGFIL